MQAASLADSQNYNVTGPSNIGQYGGGSLRFPGLISNLRLVKGTAVYTANFTPPTAPLTAITGTSLLTLQDSYFTDNSTNNLTITPFNAPLIQSASPFPPVVGTAYSPTTNGGSVYMAGSGNYLTIPNSSAYTIPASTSYTIEFWVYPLAVSTSPNFICIGDDRSANNGMLIYYSNSSSSIRVYQNGTALIVGGAMTDNQWYHIALVRTGAAAMALYVNGVLAGTASSSTTITGVAGNGIAIGAEYSGSYSVLNNFYISDVRIVSGASAFVYNGAFIPPIAPLQAITNTKLLLSGTNVAIPDLAGKVNLESTASSSTAISKFGGSAVVFNGSSTNLKTVSPVQLTGDYTIEGWFYPNGTQAANSVILQINNVSPYLVVQYYSSTGFGLATQSAWCAYSTSVLPNINAWNYFAVTRTGTIVDFYLNGVLLGTANNTGGAATVFNGTGPSYIGSGASSGFFNGYIDNIRITNGFARYAGVPPTPTEEFPPNQF